MPISSWLKKLIDRVNAQDGEEGADELVDRWPMHLRIAGLSRSEAFLRELRELIGRYEAQTREGQSMAERLKSLKYPNLTGKDWKARLHAWMQTVYDALHELEGSPKVQVPEPQDFNRAQRRLMAKFNLGLFFIPAWVEGQFPQSFVKPNWTRYLQGANIQHIKLQEGWIGYEMIQKPNYQDGVYPNDRLMQAIDLQTRFNHSHSQKGEGDDLMEDILPKAAKFLAPLGGTTRVQPAEVFNFLGNLFSWSTTHTADSFPDLGSTNAVEWCENRYGSRDALIVGGSGSGGLAYVSGGWRGHRNVSFAFRFLVQF